MRYKGKKSQELAKLEIAVDRGSLTAEALQVLQLGPSDRGPEAPELCQGLARSGQGWTLISTSEPSPAKLLGTARTRRAYQHTERNPKWALGVRV